jgi:hypothetical protein
MKNIMENYDTLTEAINALKAQGYTEDFNLLHNCLECGKGKLEPSEFKVDKFFRFDGSTDPEDESVLYAISSDKYKIKGLLVNAYGVYSDEATDELIEALKIRK